MNGKLELIRELEKRKAWGMVLKVKDGYYSSLRSRPTPRLLHSW